jgi:predicted tellurium resistance membrane protein TerC
VELWLTPEAWISLATLALLEIVLGIDNVVFISILAGKLPEADQSKARKLGLFFALFARLALLFSITWVMRLTDQLLTVAGFEISGRTLILFARPRSRSTRRSRSSTTTHR